MRARAWTILWAMALCCPAALHAATAVKSSSDATSVAGTNWTDPAYVQGNDGFYATYNNAGENYLVIKTFGFSIPSGAIIDGIQVVVNGLSVEAQTARRQFRLALTKDGSTLSGTEKIDLTLPTSDGDVTAGSGTDLWGGTWTRAEINDTNFGVMIRDNDSKAYLLSFDHATVTVSYTPPSVITASTASVAPSSIDQGGPATAMEKLSLATDQSEAVWTAIKVTKTGTLADVGVSSVTIWLDNGNGTYGAEDTIISPTAMPFTSGAANITLTAAQTLGATAKVYFIVYKLAAGANPGATIGASVASQADLTITSPDTMASTNFPANSSNSTVADVADTVTVTPTDQASGAIAQGSDFALERLSMATNAETAQWTAVKVTKTGTLADSWVTSVKVYLDDGDNGYDPEDTLISPGVTTFSGGIANVTLSAAQTLTTTAKVYFIVYDLESMAIVDATIGARVAANTDLTLSGVDTVSSTNFPIDSTAASVTDVSDTVTLTPTDMAPANVVQGADYSVEKFSMVTNDDQAAWTAVKVTKAGTLADAGVAAVRIYQDTGNGTYYGAEDILVSPSANVFSGGVANITLSAAQTLTTTAKTYFIVYILEATATPGDTIGASLASNADLTLSGVDAVASTNFPINSSNSTVLAKADEITVTAWNQAPADVDQGADYSLLRFSMATDDNTAEWTAINVLKTGTLPDAGITTVKIYLDDGDDAYDAGDTLISPAVMPFSGGGANITLTSPQTITTSAQDYFIVYGLESDAQAGTTIGASIASNGQITVTAPDTVSSANLPANSSNSTVVDGADTITVTPADAAPGSAAQGSDSALLKLSMATNDDEATWTALTVTKTGTLADGDVSTVKVYLDDGDGSYDGGDTLVSPAVNTFTSGSVAITLSAAQNITTTAKVYFVVYTLQALATVGNTIGAQVTSEASLIVTAPDNVSASNFPADSSDATVTDGQDTITVTPTNLAPASAAQDAEHAILRLSMVANQETGEWTALTVTKTGTAADSAVDSIKVYLDDGDNGYDAEDTLISPAVTTFSGGSAAITLTAAQTLTTSAKVYFIVYDLDPEAAVGSTIGGSLGAASALTVTSPDAVSSSNFPANSTNSSITDLADTITVTPTSVAPAYAIQGQASALLKLSMATPADSAQWTAITVTKTGTLARAGITAVKVYLDDGDGSYDAGDTLLGSGVYSAGGSVAITLSPAQTINSTAKAYFIVHQLTADAPVGDTTGVTVSANTQLTVTAPDNVSASNFPASSALSTVAGPPGTLTVTPTDVAPGTAAQGSDYAALKMSMATDGNTVDWSAITVTKTGTLADSGITTVKIYLDNGNGTYSSAEDTLISPSVTTFSGGSAAITLSAAQTLSPTAKVYFIVYTLTATAAPGATVGARVTANTDLTVSAPDTVASTNFPMSSGNSAVTDSADTVTVTPTDQAPVSIAQGSDFALERLSMATAVDEAVWTALKVTKNGTLADSGITTVKIYLDNGNGAYASGEDTLISPDVTTFSAGIANITLNAAQTITTTAKVYFIVYDLESTAAVGATIGASVALNTDLTMTSPDNVSATNFPVDSTASGITDVGDSVTVTPTNLAPADVVQGDEYAVEKLSMAANEDEATWTAITVTKTGTLPDADVDTVKLYLDTGNGTYGAEDTLISPAVTNFSGGAAAITLTSAQTLTSTAKVYFIVYVVDISATFPTTLGAQLASNAALTLSGVDTVASTNFPVNSTNSNVLERGDTVTVTPTNQAPADIAQDSDFAVLRLSMVTDANSAQWTAINVSKSGTLADSYVYSVKVYLDNGDNTYGTGDTLVSPAVTPFSGGAANITLTSAQTLDTSAKVYFIVYDLESDAPVGAAIGGSVASKNEVVVTAPDVVSTANFPANSSNATITDIQDTVTVTPTALSPGSIAQGADYALLKLSMATNEDEATWTGLTVTKTGTLADGDITAVKVYLDDGDGSYDAGDSLLGSGAYPGGGVSLSPTQTLTTSAKVYFIVYTLETLAAIGDTVGAQVTSNADMTVSGVDVVAATNFPASSSDSTVIDAQDTVTLTRTDLAPGSIAQDSDYAPLRLSLATDQETAQWTAIKVTKSGTLADSGVTAVKVYLDNGNGTYAGGEDTLISPAVTTFSGGVAGITLTAAQTLAASAQVYFIVYDLTPDAAAGGTIGASVASNADVTLTSPDAVSASNFPANSSNSSVTDVADTITVTPTDTAPASISQGEEFAPLKLSMATAVDQAVWTALTVTKTGNLIDSEVSAIKVYLDDGNGAYGAEDALVSPAANTFTGGSVSITLSAAQTITTTAKVYFIVYKLSLTATVGNTIGAQVTSNASLTATAPDNVSASNFPANSSNATVTPANIITVTPTNLAPASIGQGAVFPLEKLSLVTDADTAQWTAITVNKTGTLAKADVTAVRIYLDNGSGVYGPEDTQIAGGVFGGGDTVNLTLSAAQTITTTAKAYFIVYVLSAASPVTNTIGTNLTAASALTITAPDYVAATNFPVNSSLSTVAAPEIGVSLSESVLDVGSIDVNTEYVVPASVIVTNIGNVSQTYDVKAVPVTGGTPWSIGTTRGVDVFTLQTVASATQPPSGDFGSEDMLDAVGDLCTGTVFARGSVRCDKQTVGGTTPMWFKIGMPTQSSTDVAQDIQVTVAANTP